MGIMISCILLAAGLSSRFGSPKAAAKLNGKTVIEQAQESLAASLIDEILVVLGANADDIKPFLLNHKKVKLVYNKDYKFGQTSSFQAGLRQVSPAVEAVALLPVDVPFVKTATIDQLVRMFREDGPPILVPVYKDKKGHPPVFDIRLKDEFLALDPVAEGLNAVAHRHAGEVKSCPVDDEGVILTFNTPAELALLKERVS